MGTLINILIISIFCNGVYLVTRPGMILFFVHNWYLEACKGFIRSDNETVEFMYRTFPTVPRFFYKPLFGCLPCMASIWGTIGYFALGNELNWEFPLIIICVACVNRVINQIYE
jgi:hypothetical protein